jgi:uncharacterized protein YqjF (DUF2071 family)
MMDGFSIPYYSAESKVEQNNKKVDPTSKSKCGPSIRNACKKARSESK